jgi:uncharacterized protein YkwD
MTGTSGLWYAVRLRAALACLIAFAFVGASFATIAAAPRSGGQSAGPLGTSASSYCPDSEELAFLTLINNYRRQNGKPPLTLVRALGGSAEHHSRDMARYNYFSHTLHDGTTWSQNIKNHAYSYNTYRGQQLRPGHLQPMGEQLGTPRQHAEHQLQGYRDRPRLQLQLYLQVVLDHHLRRLRQQRRLLLTGHCRRALRGWQRA